MDIDVEIAKAQVELNSLIKQAEVVAKYLNDLIEIKEQVTEEVTKELS